MQKVDLSSYNNEWFKIGKPKWVVLSWYLINIIFFINPLNPISSLKVWWLRQFGAKIGKGVIIKPKVNIKYPWKLEIGDYSWIGEDVWIDNLTQVQIGKHVCLSQGAMLLTGNHNYTSTSFDLMVGKIHLEDGVWISAKAIVCPNITCYSHAVLSVNSVATRNLAPYTIYQGNPAIRIKNRDFRISKNDKKEH